VPISRVVSESFLACLAGQFLEPSVFLEMVKNYGLVESYKDYHPNSIGTVSSSKKQLDKGFINDYLRVSFFEFYFIKRGHGFVDISREEFEGHADS